MRLRRENTDFRQIQTRVEMHKHARSALGSAGGGSSARAWRTAGLPSAVAWRGARKDVEVRGEGVLPPPASGGREASVNHVKCSGVLHTAKTEIPEKPDLWFRKT